MDAKEELQKQVFAAARDQGIASVLFRNASSRKLGLNVTDSECLSLITIRGVATPTEIARYTGLTTGSTTAMLDRLEKAEYIKRRPNPDDRRGILIEVTDKYRQAAWPLVSGMQLAHAKLIGSYTPDQLATIADFLNRFTDNVKTYTKKLETNQL